VCYLTCPEPRLVFFEHSECLKMYEAITTVLVSIQLSGRDANMYISKHCAYQDRDGTGMLVSLTIIECP
jgi:hypothetical protein